MNIKNLDDVKYRIHKIKVLNENDRKAKAILKRAADQVQPIMRKRCFSVELLSEFLPRSPKLLGLNIVTKSEIKIRLREKKGGQIFHFNEIIGTLLHELAHIVHSRHDKAFYELLDRLILEYNELYVYNKKQDGPSKGKRIGGNEFHICTGTPKFMAAQAAEMRLLNNFINKDGEILNTSLESCLTTEQCENLFKNRKERDDKICSLSDDIILINGTVESSNCGENEIIEKHQSTKNDLKSINASKNTNKTFFNSSINYIKDENLTHAHSQDGSGKSFNVLGNNQKMKQDSSDKGCKENAKTLFSNNGSDCVHILNIKRGYNNLKNSENKNTLTISDNTSVKKDKKRKVIILD
ncbi:hypothetical protein, conserved [Plasmodium gonderi]|uniref:WLM domain-containing protein n=1 Tax=Plasmodium gonderi TaxID=77519 RepID=A0A1Y1JH29_PLAGO|nr:hypothetical protein, conserved [Plasmodium gonderi]GAW80517.1 hypothetical protein, conserved [Plasmodium gonderi]